MSDFIAGKIKPWETFLKERLKKYGIEKGSHYESMLYLAYDETMQQFKTAECQLNYKINHLEKQLAEYRERDKGLREVLEYSKKFYCDSYLEETRDETLAKYPPIEE